MKIKEVVKISATLLGRTDVTANLDSGETVEGSETLSTVNTLVELTNLVLTELSGSYIPLRKTEKKNAYSGKMYYKDFSENLTRVVSVIDVNGNSIEYGYHPEYIIVPQGTYTVEYEYSPTNLGLDDETGYGGSEITAGVLAYGVASEFCITEGSFDRAVMWHKRYADGVALACTPKSRNTSQRRWI